jgi:hypothetical protein
MLTPTTASSEDSIIARADPLVPPGALDGVTIMRYAHVYRARTSGGVEQYLRQLDHALLRRHRLTVLQTYLTRTDTEDPFTIENVGLGRILWVPVDIRQMPRTLGHLPKRLDYIYRRMLELSRGAGRGRLTVHLSSLRGLLSHRGGHLRYKTMILSERLFHLLGPHHVDLLVLHWLSYDTRALISRARRAGVPSFS